MNMGAGGFKEELDAGVNASDGTVEESHKRQSSREYSHDGSLDTARFNAEVDVYNGNAGWLGDLKKGLADFASSNAGIAAAASAAVLGLTAVAAAGGVAAIAMRGGGLGAAAGGIAGGIATRAGAVAAGVARFAGPAGLVVGAGAAGYGVGSVINKHAVEGTAFGDKLGESLAKTLAFFGNDEAQAAIEAQAKYDEMIAQQQQANQLSADMIGKLNSLITVTSLNKPIPMQFPKFPTAASLLDSISNKTATEEQRYGAPPSYSFLK